MNQPPHPNRVKYKIKIFYNTSSAIMILLYLACLTLVSWTSCTLSTLTINSLLINSFLGLLIKSHDVMAVIESVEENLSFLIQGHRKGRTKTTGLLCNLKMLFMLGSFQSQVRYILLSTSTFSKIALQNLFRHNFILMKI